MASTPGDHRTLQASPGSPPAYLRGSCSESNRIHEQFLQVGQVRHVTQGEQGNDLHPGLIRRPMYHLPAPTLHIPRMSMHRSLLHNWLKGLVNPPIPVTYIELSTEHRYIMDEEHSYHGITVKVRSK